MRALVRWFLRAPSWRESASREGWRAQRSCNPHPGMSSLAEPARVRPPVDAGAGQSRTAASPSAADPANDSDEDDGTPEWILRATDRLAATIVSERLSGGESPDSVRRLQKQLWRRIATCSDTGQTRHLEVVHGSVEVRVQEGSDLANLRAAAKLRVQQEVFARPHVRRIA